MPIPEAIVEIAFFIHGKPVGKGRSRSTLRGFKSGKNGKRVPVIGHYTPERTRSAEESIAAIAREAMRGRPPSSLPLRMDMEIVFAVPQSWPRWKRDAVLAGRILPTVKPDSNNVEKLVEDALNGVVWVDDSQVVEHHKTKRYGYTEGIYVCVTEIDALPAQASKDQRKKMLDALAKEAQELRIGY